MSGVCHKLRKHKENKQTFFSISRKMLTRLNFAIIICFPQTPPFDSSSAVGEKPDSMKGNIEFKDIHFFYPSRSDIKVIRLSRVMFCGRLGCLQTKWPRIMVSGAHTLLDKYKRNTI